MSTDVELDRVTIRFGSFTAVRDASLKIAGGGAGEMMRFEKTYQYCNDKVVSDSVAAVLIAAFVVDFGFVASQRFLVVWHALFG